MDSPSTTQNKVNTMLVMVLRSIEKVVGDEEREMRERKTGERQKGNDEDDGRRGCGGKGMVAKMKPETKTTTK